MTPLEAGRLFSLLRAAFPDAKRKLSEDTARLWLSELRPLDAALAEKAVRSLIVGSRFWPSIAELHEQYAIARRQAEQARLDAERRAAEEEHDATPRVALRDIPAAVQLARLFAEPLELPEIASGCCDECERSDERYRFGRFALCADCARRRLKAKSRHGEAA